MPEYNDNKAFVQSHPYRVWYLIRKQDCGVGTCYVIESNCISVFLIEGAESHFNEVLDFILSSFEPLEEIKSVRPAYFYINVPDGHEHLLKQVADLGWKNCKLRLLA